jgi:hypothetical protein
MMRLAPLLALLFCQCRTLQARPIIAFGDTALVPLDGDVYVDPAATDAEREALATHSAAALRRVGEALGGLRGAAPLAIFCKTPACQSYFAGPSRRDKTLGPHVRAEGASWVNGDRTTIILMTVDGRALAHELVHVEVGARTHTSTPAWFYEGVATFIADDPPCGDHPEKTLVESRPPIEDAREWNRYTNVAANFRPTYCQARAEVDAWITSHGRERFWALLDGLGGGGRFAQLYGPLLTQ